MVAIVARPDLRHRPAGAPVRRAAGRPRRRAADAHGPPGRGLRRASCRSPRAGSAPSWRRARRRRRRRRRLARPAAPGARAVPAFVVLAAPAAPATALLAPSAGAVLAAALVVAAAAGLTVHRRVAGVERDPVRARGALSGRVWRRCRAAGAGHVAGRRSRGRRGEPLAELLADATERSAARSRPGVPSSCWPPGSASRPWLSRAPPGRGRHPVRSVAGRSSCCCRWRCSRSPSRLPDAAALAVRTRAAANAWTRSRRPGRPWRDRTTRAHCRRTTACSTPGA